MTSSFVWLGNCWHQAFTSTSSAPTMVLTGEISSPDTRPLTTHPSTFAPGGVGQGSVVEPGVPHRGAVPPMGASYVYVTYTYGRVGKSGSSVNALSPRSQKLCTL